MSPSRWARARCGQQQQRMVVPPQQPQGACSGQNVTCHLARAAFEGDNRFCLPTLAIAAAVTDASDEASQPQCLCGGGNPVQCYSGAGHCIWDTIKPAPGPSQKQHLENSKLKFTWRAISDCAPKQQTAIKQWQTEAVWIIDYLWFAWWTGKAKKICSRLTRSYSAFPYAKWSWKKSKQTTTKKGFVFNWNSFRPAFNFGGFFLYPLKKWSIYPN